MNRLQPTVREMFPSADLGGRYCEEVRTSAKRLHLNMVAMDGMELANHVPKWSIPVEFSAMGERVCPLMAGAVHYKRGH